MRPRIVALNNDRYIILWELWTGNKSQKQTFNGTCAMVINGSGNIVVGEKVICQTHIPRGNDPMVLDNQAAFVTGDQTNKSLVIHTIGSDLSYQSYSVK